MKGAVSFGDQVEISSGDSSSSNTDDRKTESKWMKNTITVDQPVSEWDSEGGSQAVIITPEVTFNAGWSDVDQKITRFINASGRVKNIPIPGTVHHDTSSSDVEHIWETKGTQASTFKFMSSRISIPGSSRIAEVDTRNLFILDLKVESSDLDQVKEVPVTCKPKRWWLSMNSGNSSMALESRHHPIPKPLLREWIRELNGIRVPRPWYFSPTQLDMSCPTPKLVNGSASTPGTPLQPLPEPITS
ncbi:hypothetical protein KY284_005292 [Solanum tuberosum]|nr:hypothetical protein KY284_005292 [Solanum tuberosum]